ncbi:MAG: metalloregulator ArsR/SmtB family transcription factor [Streptosporangiaceae bacterium]
MPPDIEAIAEQVFVALADPSRRAILAGLAAGGPVTATDLADRLPITRQAIAKHLALLSEAGLVKPEPGERRRVRYRLRSEPMQVAQQFLAALARDWDGPLDALTDHLDRKETEGTHHDHEDTPDRHGTGVGGRAPAAASEGEGADPGQGRAGRAASADAVAGGGEGL